MASTSSKKPWERAGLTGAGVVPFAVLEREPGDEASVSQEVMVLFHTKEVGKKVGYLVDFGGGVGEDEGDDSAVAVAAREMSEETAGVFDLSPDELARQPIASNRAVQASPLTTLATGRLLARLLKGLGHYGEVAARVEEEEGGDGDKVWHGSTDEGGYEVFFVRMPYVSADELNQLFAVSDRRCRFQWVPLNELVEGRPPLPLHPRLVAIHGLPAIWTAIAAHHQRSK
jgi:hypothetical protein